MHFWTLFDVCNHLLMLNRKARHMWWLLLVLIKTLPTHLVALAGHAKVGIRLLHHQLASAAFPILCLHLLICQPWVSLVTEHRAISLCVSNHIFLELRVLLLANCWNWSFSNKLDERIVFLSLVGSHHGFQRAILLRIIYLLVWFGKCSFF